MHDFSNIYEFSHIVVYALVCHYDTIIAILNTFHFPAFAIHHQVCCRLIGFCGFIRLLE